MSDEIEYIEPTQEHVGQMVEVSDDFQHWYSHKLLGIINAKQKYIVEEDLIVFGWIHARTPRQLTYAERQARCGLNVGDRVRVMTLPEAGQDGWKAGVSGSMRHLVGTVHRITQDSKEYGFTVGGWNFPYFVLEKVEDRVATFNDIGKQVYVEGTPSDAFTFEIVYGIEGDVWRAVVRSGDKRFVYELSNLRVKE